MDVKAEHNVIRSLSYRTVLRTLASTHSVTACVRVQHDHPSLQWSSLIIPKT